MLNCLKFREGASSMTTVQDILQRLGKPPVEVCLDWAWQLDKLAQPQPTQTAHPTKSTSHVESSAGRAASRDVMGAVDVAGDLCAVGDDKNDFCSWSQLTIDDHGRLHWLSSTAARPTRPDGEQPDRQHTDSEHTTRLAQLLQWCDVDDTLQANSAAPASHQLHTHLRRRTLQWASIQTSTASPTESPSIAPTGTVAAAAKRLPGLGHATPVRYKSRKRPTLRILAATLAAAGLLLASAIALTQRAASTTASSSASLPQSAPVSITAPASIFEATSQQALATRPPRRAQTQSGGSSNETSAHSPTERHTELPAVEHAEQPLALSTDAVLAPDPLASPLGSSADPTSLLQDAAVGTMNLSSQRQPTDTTQELSSQPAPELSHYPLHAEDATHAQIAIDAKRPADSNVLAELAALSKSAEETTSEVKIASPEPTPTDSASADAVPPEPVSAPLLLQSYPMIQLQEFDKRVRVRQPQWRLRLVASQGLEVLPSVAQELSDSQWVDWAIRSAAPSQSQDQRPRSPPTPVDSGTTRVAVQVRLSNKRETSLQWRIVATSEAHPQIAVPLDQAWLDRFQEYLSNYIAGLQQESQRMRELGRAGGVPSHARSALSARRRGLDAESKLAAELLQIVADANQMVGWLDGQIEVHGDLVDAAANPPVVLLQFGSP